MLYMAQLYLSVNKKITLNQQSTVKFHFVGLKCGNCGGYNTSQNIQKRTWTNSKGIYVYLKILSHLPYIFRNSQIIHQPQHNRVLDGVHRQLNLNQKPLRKIYWSNIPPHYYRDILPQTVFSTVTNTHSFFLIQQLHFTLYK